MAPTELSLERHRFISNLAEDVWNTYSGERQVYLDGVANAVGVSLSYGDYGDAFDGLLEHKNAAFHIYINTARGQPANSPRARFTLGHELGHYFIDEHRNALMAGMQHFSFTEHPSEDSPVETEANLFAANLLMPNQELVKALTEISAGLTGIVDLASTFMVSIQSAALQFAQRGRKSCAIIMFRENGKLWWCISPELRGRGYKWMQKLTTDGIPEDSASGRSKMDSYASLGEVHQSGTLASVWFKGVLRGSATDIMLTESSIRLRGRGFLTLLEPVAG
jgi:Zn-dependent peptidase ImmA (M78 family)